MASYSGLSTGAGFALGLAAGWLLSRRVATATPASSSTSSQASASAETPSEDDWISQERFPGLSAEQELAQHDLGSPPDRLVIRTATQADLRACREIYSFYVDTAVATFAETLDSTQQFAANWSTNLSTVVATTRDIVVGYALLIPQDRRSGYKHTAQISIYVSANYRSRGIGKALLSELISRARSTLPPRPVVSEPQRRTTENGYVLDANQIKPLDKQLWTLVSIIANSSTDGLPSAKLHTRMGFRFVGSIDGIGYKFGRRLDISYYVLELLEPDRYGSAYVAQSASFDQLRPPQLQGLTTGSNGQSSRAVQGLNETPLSYSIDSATDATDGTETDEDPLLYTDEDDATTEEDLTPRERHRAQTALESAQFRAQLQDEYNRSHQTVGFDITQPGKKTDNGINPKGPVATANGAGPGAAGPHKRRGARPASVSSRISTSTSTTSVAVPLSALPVATEISASQPAAVREVGRSERNELQQLMDGEE